MDTISVTATILLVPSEQSPTRYAVVSNADDLVFLSGFWYERREGLEVAQAAVACGDPANFFANRFAGDEVLQKRIAELNSDAAPDPALAAAARKLFFSIAAQLPGGSAHRWPRTPQDEQYLTWKESGV